MTSQTCAQNQRCIGNRFVSRFPFRKAQPFPKRTSRSLPCFSNNKKRNFTNSLQRRETLIPMASQQTSSVSSDQTIADLQAKFGIAGSVEIVAGNGGLPMVRLTHSCGSLAEVYLFGACVTSWKQSSGNEILYIRPDAVFDKSKPISGGVPICFPQFGPGELPQHGFARNLDWQITNTSADPQPDDKEPRVELMLTETDETLKIFPHRFNVVYTVTLHDEHLKTEFRVVNTDSTPFTFTGALHGYYEVAHVSKARVFGLQGLKTLDKVPNPEDPVPGEMTDEYLLFEGPVDKVFLDGKDYVELEVGTGAAVAMSSSNWRDVVCWNPHLEMPDFYEKFVCVENAKFNPQTVEPGQSWIGETDYTIKNV